MAAWQTKVAITIGNGCSFAMQELEGTTAIKAQPRLVLLDSKDVMVANFGYITKNRIEYLKNLLGRLSIHAPE